MSHGAFSTFRDILSLYRNTHQEGLIPIIANAIDFYLDDNDFFLMTPAYLYPIFQRCYGINVDKAILVLKRLNESQPDLDLYEALSNFPLPEKDKDTVARAMLIRTKQADINLLNERCDGFDARFAELEERMSNDYERQAKDTQNELHTLDQTIKARLQEQDKKMQEFEAREEINFTQLEDKFYEEISVLEGKIEDLKVTISKAFYNDLKNHESRLNQITENIKTQNKIYEELRTPSESRRYPSPNSGRRSQSEHSRASPPKMESYSQSPEGRRDSPPKSVKFQSPRSSPTKVDADTDVFDACRKGEYNTVQLRLQQDNNLVFKKNYYGDTLLHYSACYGHLSIYQLLVDHGARVNEKNSEGETPLHMAAFNGFTEICSKLCRDKANVNEKNKDGYTPLHLVARYGHIHCCSLLIQNNANINEKNNLGYTPLHLAVQFNKLSVCTMLLTNGAYINEKDKAGQTPLHLACRYGLVDVCNLLISDHANINDKDNDKHTPLHFAAQKGYPEICKLLINHGASVNERDLEGSTPYGLAQKEEIRLTLKASGGFK